MFLMVGRDEFLSWLTLSDETEVASFDDNDGADLSTFLFFNATIGSGFSCGYVVTSNTTGTSDLTIAFFAISLAFCFIRLTRWAANFAF
jgi:hypothetical protein